MAASAQDNEQASSGLDGVAAADYGLVLLQPPASHP
jgi:hypothetical protein